MSPSSVRRRVVGHGLDRQAVQPSRPGPHMGAEAEVGENRTGEDVGQRPLAGDRAGLRLEEHQEEVLCERLLATRTAAGTLLVGDAGTTLVIGHTLHTCLVLAHECCDGSLHRVPSTRSGTVR